MVNFRNASYRVVPPTEHLDNGSSMPTTPPSRHLRVGPPTRGLIVKEISWRFVLALVSSIGVMVTLDLFARVHSLNPSERRWFTVLTILFSSLVSLSVGSLLQFLGNMMRWPLLASRKHSLGDVDLVLGIANPTGSLKLLWRHSREWRWTVSTAIVAIYFLVNIMARLSVAAFGLSFDLNDLPKVLYPDMTTDWGSPDWFNLSMQALTGTFSTDYPPLDPNLVRLNNYAMVGLTIAQTRFNASAEADYNVSDIDGQGIDRRVEGQNVTYSYHLKQYNGLNESSTDKAIHSSSTCIARLKSGKKVLRDGNEVGDLDELKSDSPTFLHVLNYALVIYKNLENDYVWLAPLNYSEIPDPSACFTTFMYKNTADEHDERDNFGSLYECTTCLRNHRGSPGVGDGLLPRLPTANETYNAGLLLRFGVFERVYKYDPDPENPVSLSIRLFNGMDKVTHFSNGLPALPLPDDADDAASGLARAELHAAQLAARLPPLALLGAQTQLPRVSLDGQEEKSYVETVLVVRWDRAFAVLASMLAGQVVVVVIVFAWCRKVVVQDHDSFLAVARLLRRAMVEEIRGATATRTGRAEMILASQGEKNDLMLQYGAPPTCKTQEIDLLKDM